MPQANPFRMTQKEKQILSDMMSGSGILVPGTSQTTRKAARRLEKAGYIIHESRAGHTGGVPEGSYLMDARGRNWVISQLKDPNSFVSKDWDKKNIVRARQRILRGWSGPSHEAAYTLPKRKRAKRNPFGDKYKIVRMFQDPNKRSRTIKRGLTLEEAQAHARDPETSSSTCTSARCKRYTRTHGDWFDGYELEKPKRKRNPAKATKASPKKNPKRPSLASLTRI